MSRIAWICLKATGYDNLNYIRTNQHRPKPAERVLWAILLAQGTPLSKTGHIECG